MVGYKFLKSLWWSLNGECTNQKNIEYQEVFINLKKIEKNTFLKVLASLLQKITPKNIGI